MKQVPVKSTIKFEDLEKIDVRVGTIEKVEDIEESDKLVRLIVDFGEFKRTILVGMKKERENPAEIEGKQALFVVNLEPRKMMGEMSEGMVFDIGYGNDITPVLAIPEKSVPNGACAG
jgi:tRNA-binding protein